MNEQNNLYDFYYSAKMESRIRESGSAINVFKGQKYTEAITAGTPPVSNYDDLNKIGTGTFDDVKISPLN